MNAMFGNIADKRRAGRAFVDQLRVTSDLFIQSLPNRKEFQALLSPLELDVIT